MGYGQPPVTMTRWIRRDGSLKRAPKSKTPESHSGGRKFDPYQLHRRIIDVFERQGEGRGCDCTKCAPSGHRLDFARLEMRDGSSVGLLKRPAG